MYTFLYKNQTQLDESGGFTKKRGKMMYMKVIWDRTSHNPVIWDPHGLRLLFGARGSISNYKCGRKQTGIHYCFRLIWKVVHRRITRQAVYIYNEKRLLIHYNLR